MPTEMIELAGAEGDRRAWLPMPKMHSKNSPIRAERDKIEALLAGEADGNDTYLEIHAGAGGTESQDWAEMLQRMYQRWAERRGFKVELVDYHAGEQAGIKSATLLLKGENAYGYAKTESGVHRLVRISPYDSSARRHTSFSSIWVYPVIDEDIDVEINESDLQGRYLPGERARVASMSTRPTAPYGLRMSRPASWLRRNRQRSQHKNRAEAMSMLKARLYEAELRRREEEANAVRGEQIAISAGAARFVPTCSSRIRW